MISLQLEVPGPLYLETNAQPAVAALNKAIEKVQASLLAFTGRNDTRDTIQEDVQRVVECAAELAAVHNLDPVKLAKATEFNDYRARIGGGIRSLTQAASQVYSDEPSAAYPLKLLRQALLSVRKQFSQFREDHDDRSALAKAVEDVQRRLSEVRAMNAGIDEWGPRGVDTACEQLLRVLEETIPTASHTVDAVLLPYNTARMRVSDDVDDLISQLGFLNNPGDLFQAERKRIMSDARALRSEVCKDLSTEISDPQALAVKIRQLQADVRGIVARIAQTPPSQLGAFSRDAGPWAEKQFKKVLAHFEDAPVTPKPKTTIGSLISNLGRAAIWEA